MVPKFSVLIPVYNAEKYIESCVQSVKEQSFQDFEIVLVDDGSTDKSGQLCDRLAAEDARISAYHKPNAGQLHTRLFAIEKAEGQYYIFLDADDTLVSNALEMIYDAFERTGSDCVFYELQRVRDGVVIETVEEKPEETISDKRELYRKCFLNYAYNSMCCRAVSANLCKKKDCAGWYDLRHGEDLLQSIDILRNCNVATFLNRALYNYNYNPTSVTSMASTQNYRIDFSLRETVLQFLQQEAVFTEADYQQYRTLCVQIMLRTVKRIGRIEASKAEKCQLLEEIRKQDYYQNFLVTGAYDKKKLGKDEFLFYLLKKRMDGMLLAVIKLFAVLLG